MKEYSKNCLAKPEDKSIAISGLAKEMISVLEEEYYGGLCCSALPQMFLRRTTGAQSNETSSSKPANYRAPSCSWAYLDGMVSFSGSLEKNDLENILIKVLKCGITLASAHNLHGAVSDEFIKAMGLLWPVKLKMNAGALDLRL